MKTNHTQEEFDRLKAVNAELLAVLEKCVEFVECAAIAENHYAASAESDARAAIAKARGE